LIQQTFDARDGAFGAAAASRRIGDNSISGMVWHGFVVFPDL